MGPIFRKASPALLCVALAVIFMAFCVSSADALNRRRAPGPPAAQGRTITANIVALDQLLFTTGWERSSLME